MYKIIDLGCNVPDTGEPRVRLLSKSLVKTASVTSGIQQFWDKLSLTDGKAYLWVIAVSAMEFYGANNNGDAFHEDDLVKTCDGFVKDAHIFIHHVNRDPAKSIGKPIYAYYNGPMHRVELILEIDKSLPGAEAIVDQIKAGQQMYVSMGARLSFDVCSICGHHSKTRAEYCDHLKFNLKKILPDGRQVYAINPNPHFFDISIVTRPADPTAFALDKIAEEGEEGEEQFISSAELGDMAEDFQEKVASVNKLADIIKHVDNAVIDRKPSPIRTVIMHANDMDRPEINYDALDAAGATPRDLIHGLAHFGAPLSLSDAHWMSGVHRFMPLQRTLEMLPSLLDVLKEHIPNIPHLIRRVTAYPESPKLTKILVIKIIRPVACHRISLLSGGDDGFFKLGEEMGPLAYYTDTANTYFGSTNTRRERIGNNFLRDFSDEGENLKQYVFTDRNGNSVKTSQYSIENSIPDAILDIHNPLYKKIFGGMLTFSALGALLSANPTILNSILGVGLGALGTKMISDAAKNERRYVDSSGQVEVPAETLNDAFKRNITKTAQCGIPSAPTELVMLDYALHRYTY